VGNASGNAATINVGDNAKAGLLSITGTYTQLATGTMTGLVNGTTAGTGFSQLKVTGTAALAGTINFTVATAFQGSLTVGEAFTALTAGSVTGTFSNTTIAINSNFHFVVSYTSTGVVLTVASGPVAHSGTAAASQLALVNTRQSIPTAKQPMSATNLRHGIGAAVKTARPVFVAGLRTGSERSGARVDPQWEQVSLRPRLSVPLVSDWRTAPGAVAHVVSVPVTNSVRQMGSTSPSWSGMRQSVTGARIVNRLAGVTNRGTAPVKVFPMHLPMARLGQ